MSITYELNSKIGRRIKTYCPYCKHNSNHTIVANYGGENDDEFPYATIDYEIIRCDGCDFISFREESYDQNDFLGYKNNVPVINISEVRYPSNISGIKFNEWNIFNIPISCRKIYKETEFSLANDQILLSAVGLRMLIESICNDQIKNGNIEFKSKNLYGKIDELVENGILTKKSGEILHGIREIGNSSTHELKPTNINHLKIAFDIIENLLLMLYIFPKEFSKE